ncbi:patatin-like phospholipase family protein, partial [Gammaproteobacteria bacterium]|nr:patatin-like phospholipase family protein [Gammaproteobacteria bacterium]
MHPLVSKNLPFVRKALMNALPMIDESTTDTVLEAASWRHAAAGDHVFECGTAGEALYLVVTGRLEALMERHGQQRVVNQFGTGDTLGEIAVVAGGNHIVTTRAMRDSELLVIRRAQVLELLETHRGLVGALMRSVVHRLIDWSERRKQIPDRVTNVVLHFEGLGGERRRFAEQLAEAFSAFGSVRMLRSETIDAAQARAINAGEWPFTLLDRLDRLEQDCAKVIYVGCDGYDDHGSTVNLSISEAWNRLCARQADRLLLVMEATGSKEPSARERALVERCHVDSELVLVSGHHRDRHGSRGRAAGFQRHRKLRRVHRVRFGSEGDMQRVARFLNARAIGLVLGGGAARGVAHIGALQAFSEAGIAIDAIAGTSIGGLYAGIYALGATPEEIRERSRWAFTEFKPLNDYTIPRYALLRGEKLDQVLHKVFGNSRMEDTRIRFFCVAGNLSTGRIKVLREGPLWQGIRASVSLPGILPPVEVNGELLVDGGMVNNFPVDIMAGGGIGTVIGALPTASESGSREPFIAGG